MRCAKKCFFFILATAISGMPTLEIRFLPGQFSVELALQPQYETSCDSEIQTKEDFKSKFRKQLGSLALMSLNSTDKKRSIRISLLKVASPNGLNSRRVKLEQSNNQRHLVYKDVVLCIYSNYRICILHMYCKSHLGREWPTRY